MCGVFKRDVCLETQFPAYIRVESPVRGENAGACAGSTFISFREPYSIFTNGVIDGTGLDAAIPPKNSRT